MDPVRQTVLPRINGRIKPNGGGYLAQCPAHEDKNPSLSIHQGSQQPVVLHCMAGCEADDVLTALGLTWDELSQPREQQQKGEWTPNGEAIACYNYRDENGTLLYQVLRTAGKDFPTRVPDPNMKSGWRWKLGNVRRVPYRLPQLLEGLNEGNMVYICEGEKDVLSVEKAGGVATTNPGGAKKWNPEFAEFFRDADVLVVADKDKQGQKHARQVARTLDGLAAMVGIAEPADEGEIKDVTDHLEAGFSLDDLMVTWNPNEEPPPDLAPDLYDFLNHVDPPEDWVVDGLIERGDRFMLTGLEGLGKSTLGRQVAVCVAAGLHPFDFYEIKPANVLFIDCENAERKARPKFRSIYQIVSSMGYSIEKGKLRLKHHPNGMDASSEDHDWLVERVTAHKPDLLFIGPLYRLHTMDPSDEVAARAITNAIDSARIKVDCAVIVEAHSGHGTGSDRQIRPLGSSLFLRWPEFGYGLKQKYEGSFEWAKFEPWRGPREERYWPTELVRGNTNELPWKRGVDDSKGVW